MYINRYVLFLYMQDRCLSSENLCLLWDSTPQEEGHGRKKTSDHAQIQDLRSITEFGNVSYQSQPQILCLPSPQVYQLSSDPSVQSNVSLLMLTALSLAIYNPQLYIKQISFLKQINKRTALLVTRSASDTDRLQD